LKADIVEESVTQDGNAFQTQAPATGKERSPIVVLRVGGTTTAVEDVDYLDQHHQEHTAAWSVAVSTVRFHRSRS